jgi:hypothetical protein
LVGKPKEMGNSKVEFRRRNEAHNLKNRREVEVVGWELKMCKK